MSYDYSIGTRVIGQPPARHERWYECAVCGLQYPESETIVPEVPLPHAGRRVCVVRCNDEPSYDYYQITAPYRPSGEENKP